MFNKPSFVECYSRECITRTTIRIYLERKQNDQKRRTKANFRHRASGKVKTLNLRAEQAHCALAYLMMEKKGTLSIRILALH